MTDFGTPIESILPDESSDRSDGFTQMLDACYKRTTFSIAKILKILNSSCKLLGTSYFSHSPINNAFFRWCAVGNNISNHFDYYFIKRSTLDALKISRDRGSILQSSNEIERVIGKNTIESLGIKSIIILPIPPGQEDKNRKR